MTISNGCIYHMIYGHRIMDDLREFFPPVGTWRRTGYMALSSPSPVSLSAPFGPARFLSAPLDLPRPGSDSNRK